MRKLFLFFGIWLFFFGTFSAEGAVTAKTEKAVQIVEYFNYGIVDGGETEKLVRLLYAVPKAEDFWKTAEEKEMFTGRQKKRMIKLNKKWEKRLKQYDKLSMKIKKGKSFSRSEREQTELLWIISLCESEGIIDKNEGNWLTSIAMEVWGDDVNFFTVALQGAVITREQLKRIGEVIKREAPQDKKGRRFNDKLSELVSSANTLI